MKEQLIREVQRQMLPYLNNAQLKQLQGVLEGVLSGVELSRSAGMVDSAKVDTVACFINAKRIEGCSERTIAYYKVTAEKMLSNITKPLRKMTTEDLRSYLSFYQSQNGCSKITVDNVRRNLSSFFSWLEEEDHILKSPIRRIHKIKSKTTVKETITDENIEKLRDGCVEVRDLAIIDLLYSTGIRVGELVNLDIEDINFEERECIVYGKGDKERIVPILPPVREKILHYLDEIDRQGICISKEKALFLNQQGKRISRSTVYRTVQSQLRQGGVQGKKSPHVLRHTFATELLNNGADMRAIQELLGHASLQATQVYTHNSIAKLQEIYSKAHPREKNGAEQTKQQN